MTGKPIIDQEALDEFSYSSKGDSFDGFTVARSSKAISVGRWMSTNETIIRRDADGTFWRLLRNVPLTENSGEHEDTEIDCQVWPHEVTVIEYRNKP